MSIKLEKAIDKAISVEDLIQELRTLNPKSKVVFAYNYGDYWRTIVAPFVTTVDEGEVVWSSDHNLPKIVDKDKRGEDERETTPVVVLKSHRIRFQRKRP